MVAKKAEHPTRPWDCVKGYQVNNELEQLRTGLEMRDPLVCGNAPLWVVEILTSQVNSLLPRDRNVLREETHDFALGAIRFVSDNNVADCEVLLSCIGKLA